MYLRVDKLRIENSEIRNLGSETQRLKRERRGRKARLDVNCDPSLVGQDHQSDDVTTLCLSLSLSLSVYRSTRKLERTEPAMGKRSGSMRPRHGLSPAAMR